MLYKLGILNFFFFVSMSLELFEAVLQVTLESIVDGGNIEFCYPPNRGHSDQVKQAPAFCFPEQQSFRTSLLLLK